jgi:hypothetical protein
MQNFTLWSQLCVFDYRFPASSTFMGTMLGVMSCTEKGTIFSFEAPSSIRGLQYFIVFGRVKADKSIKVQTHSRISTGYSPT